MISMSADVFVDTNVIAYAFDQESPVKRRVAQELIGQADFVISAQVLSELFVTLTHKLKQKVPAEVARQAINELQVLRVIDTTPALVLRAIDTSVRYQLSYWDALIIEAALAAGCATLVTEDLTEGALYKGLRVVNPFGDQPDATDHAEIG